MNGILHSGQQVSTKLGQTCVVEKLLGAGGQGEVYKIKYGGADYALKWYFPHTATAEQYKALESLVQAGPPSASFLWPLDMATADGVAGYGYIMPLRDQRFKSLVDLVAGRIKPSFSSLITACIELTKSLRKLHTEGLCYRDISFGNAFFDPNTGEVLVCDNDNVTENNSKSCGVLGTPDFMAPEIVCGQAMPSRDTDLHSLAVLLFYMLHIGHPLQGERVLKIRCWDLAAREELFGKNPVFIFDPNNPANKAVQGDSEAGGNALGYWKLYPQFFQNTFIKAFTVGLKDPKARVTEAEWLESLSGLRNSLFRCTCGTPNFYDVETIKANGKPNACWGCGKAPQLPFRIKIGKSIVMLNFDTRLHPHHLGVLSGGDYDFSTDSAEVTQHPSDPTKWGLKNLTDTKWVITLPDGSVRDVEPGKNVPLANGVKIQFGKADGEVRY